MLVSDGFVGGVEIGQRGCRVAVADLHGRIVADESRLGAPEPPLETIATIAALLQQAIAQAGLRPDQIVRLGCGFPGPVDVGSGLVLLSHRLAGWEDLPLGSLLEERLGAPILLDNDARVAALGEARFGAGRGERHLAYIHLGAGLGGGLVIDGRVHHGATMTAGEIGHVLMTEDGPLCSCGKAGHLEAYASGTAIVQRTLALAEEIAADGPFLRRLAQGMPASPTLVFECARDGDLAAQRIINEAVRFLGIALANLVTTFNPSVVVVGGRAAEAGPLLFDPLRSVVRRYAMAVPARAVRIVPSTLKSDGIIVGAIAMALQSLT